MQAFGHPLHKHVHARHRPDREVHQQVRNSLQMRLCLSSADVFFSRPRCIRKVEAAAASLKLVCPSVVMSVGCDRETATFLPPFVTIVRVSLPCLGLTDVCWPSLNNGLTSSQQQCCPGSSFTRAPFFLFWFHSHRSVLVDMTTQHNTRTNPTGHRA